VLQAVQQEQVVLAYVPWVPDRTPWGVQLVWEAQALVLAVCEGMAWVG